MSTHALMRAGVMQLERWGILGDVVAAGTPPVRTTTFHYGDETIAIDIKPSAEAPYLVAPRRTVLDRLLVDHARAAGAEIRFGCRLEELVRDAQGRVVGVELMEDQRRLTLSCDLVVGADGVQSTVAELTGAAIYKRARHAAACVFGYWPDQEVDGYHWYYNPGVTAGVIPTNGGTCVFVGLPPTRLHAAGRDVQGCFERVLGEAAPELAAKFPHHARLPGLRRFPGLRGFFRQSAGPGWALVGDAAYFKDPQTAHGITDALRDAELLADAITSTDTNALAAYQATRDALSHRLFEVSDTISSLRWSLPELKALHLELMESMRAEVTHLQALNRTAAAAA